MKTILAIAMALAALPSVAAPTLELKGLRPGMPKDSVLAMIAGTECTDHPTEPRSQVCNYRSKSNVGPWDTLAEIPVDWRLRFREGELIEVTTLFNNGHAASMKSALVAKFGPGKHSDNNHWEEGSLTLLLVVPQDGSTARVGLFSRSGPTPRAPDADPSRIAKDL